MCFPYGIRLDAGGAPEGWRWVEADEQAGVYNDDRDAADALITAGIGTEWQTFDGRVAMRFA